MTLTREAVLDQLRKVNDPELHRDLVSLDMVRQVAIEGGQVQVHIELTTPACPLKDQIEADVRGAIEALGDAVKGVEVTFTAKVRSGGGAKQGENNPLPDVKNIIAVGAGKGGVGKSTISVNVAVGLARAGASVGLLDGDIYGPSLPTMLGIRGHEIAARGNMMLPFEVHGVKAMTIGALVEDDKPLIWRGPMAHGAFRDLVTRTIWGPLDYLVIDLPPGTGDVPLSMSQMLPLTGAVVVCTPQRVAQDDASRAVGMFEQLRVPLLGVVENMSYFIGDDGKTYDIFGRGGAEAMAGRLGAPFLGAVPINMALRANSDGGTPSANFEEGNELRGSLEQLVRNLAGRVSVETLAETATGPTLSVS